MASKHGCPQKGWMWWSVNAWKWIKLQGHFSLQNFQLDVVVWKFSKKEIATNLPTHDIVVIYALSLPYSGFSLVNTSTHMLVAMFLYKTKYKLLY